MSTEQIEQQMNTQMTNKFTIKYDGMDEVMTKEEFNNLISAMKHLLLMKLQESKIEIKNFKRIVRKK